MFSTASRYQSTEEQKKSSRVVSSFNPDTKKGLNVSVTITHKDEDESNE